MIVNERIVAYINSIDTKKSDICEAIEKEAIADNVPIIRKEMGNLLKVLIMMKAPKRILEVGAAVGYSSILMSEYMPKDCTITTIENYDKRIKVAKKNLVRAGKQDKITLLEGDAQDILPTLEPYYDFIFMDAAKGQYIHFLPEVLRLIEKGGVLITDNVLQDGDIVESRYGVIRRNRTIHTRMRDYLYTLTHMEEFETSIIPIGDGITLSIRR
ncbi:MAG: O-methyltransferase [Lachnospiraceae bacterium]|nr:O-methyltransferase [Lachnospiraceae bacterium]